MAEDSKILAAIEEQKTAYAAMEKAMKDGNREVLAKAEQAYDKAKATADGMKAVQDAQAAQQAKLEELELSIQSAAVIGGGKKPGEYNDAQQAYNASFATALRNGANVKEMNISAAAAYAALTEKDDTAGGFFVSPTLSNRIITEIPRLNPMRGVAMVEAISSNQLDVIADPEEVEASWYEETESTTDTTTGKVYKHQIPVCGLRAKIKVSRNLVMDSRYDIERRIVAKASNAFANAERDANINGTGNKKPQGLFTVTMATDSTSLAYGTFGYVKSGAASTIGSNADALISIIDALDDAYKANAKFMCSGSTITAIRQLKATSTVQGYMLWTPSFQPGQPDTLLGYPLVKNSACPTIAADAFPLVFADFSQAYTIVDRQTMYLLIDNITDDAFIIYKFFWRVGGGAVDSRAAKFLKISA